MGTDEFQIEISGVDIYLSVPHDFLREHISHWSCGRPNAENLFGSVWEYLGASGGMAHYSLRY